MKQKAIKLFASLICLLVLMCGALVSMSFDSKTENKKPHTEHTEPTYPNSYMIENISALEQVELSAGCEVYACTVLLQYLGFDIDEHEFSENYLITSPISYDENIQRYGPDMNSAYAGDVYEGYGIYAPAMAKSMNKYLHTTNTDKQAIIAQEVSLEKLCHKYVTKDIPVMVWATTYMHEPYVKAEWIIDYVDENSDKCIGDIEQWMQNEHCLVLMGYDSEHYYFCDSVSGEISAYEKEVSQKRFSELGSQAIVVK